MAIVSETLDKQRLWNGTIQDVTASRSTGVTYTNGATARFVSVIASPSVGTASLNVNGFEAGRVNTGELGQLTFILPPDADYDLSGGTITIVSWLELQV